LVDSLLAAGCKVVGKANMHELAFGMTGVNATFGTPVNPIWPDLIPGGSSSGTAVAVADGFSDFGIGTDTGGSVRQPAICCGLYGMKPSFGRISRAGCTPHESSLDCVGVMARSAEMLTKAMAATDPSFVPETLEAAPRLTRIKSDLDTKIGDFLLYGLMEGVPVSGYAPLHNMHKAYDAAMTVIGAEMWSAFGPLVSSGAPIGADVATRIRSANGISATAVAEAEHIRAVFAAEVDALLESTDALITPAFPTLPPRVDAISDPATVLELGRFLRPFNLSGHPAIVLPVEPDPASGPMGVQIIGRKGSDAQLCSIACWLAKTCSIFRQEGPIQ